MEPIGSGNYTIRKKLKASFLMNLQNDSSKTRFYTFMGDAAIDIEKEAKTRFNKIMVDEEKMDSKLDMEPLRVLSSISLDKGIREVDGSLQIAKNI